MKKIFFCIIALAFSSTIFAQTTEITQTVRGVVLDVSTETTIPGATIILSNSNPQIGAITDTEGEFILENVSVGRHTFEISYLGYKPALLSNLMVVSGKETVLTIRLEEKVELLNEVVIKGRTKKAKANNEMAMVSARSFSIDETERYAGSLGDPSRMAANFAGVMSVSDQRNDIVIRGNSPLGLLWQLDDVSIPNPNHFGALGTTGGPVSMLNNNLLDNSDFFTGAFPAEYGNATSGVFDLKMRNGNNRKHEFVAQVGFNGFEVGAEGPFSEKSKASYLINFRYSTMELMQNLGMEFGTGASVPQYKDLSFKVNIPLKNGKISMFGIGGISFIALNEEDLEEGNSSYNVAGTNTDFGSDMAVSGISHTHYFNKNTRLISSISAQGMRSTTVLDSLDRDRNPYPYYRNEVSEMKYSGKMTFKKKFNAKNNISIGSIINYYHLNTIDSVKRNQPEDFLSNSNTAFRTITDYNGNFSLFEAFAEWQHKFTDDLTLYLGLHGQVSSINNDIALEPRFGLQWQFAEKHSLHLGAGMHSQLQPHFAYFVKTELLDGSYIETNNNLGFTKSNQLIVGYDFNASQDFRIKLEAYYQQLYNVPISPNDTWYSLLNEGANFGMTIQDSLVNEGTGTNYGIELTIEKFFSKNYYFLVTTSLYESKYIAYDEIERNTAFNGNFVLNTLFGYELELGKKSSLSFDIKGVLAGGKRIVPILLDESIVAQQQILDYDNIYEERYDNYAKIDIRISFKRNSKKLSQEWALDIQNVTNNENIFQQTYIPLDGKIKTDYQTGLYPMFLYRIRF